VKVLVPVIILLVVFLFVAGVLLPRRSRRLQRWMDNRLRRGERKGARSGGRVGDWAARALQLLRRYGDRTVEAGRRVRRKAPR
jgi:hypothetical protein